MSRQQASNQSNNQFESIKNLNLIDIYNYADQHPLFREYYPYMRESETADKIFTIFEVLEHFQVNIIDSMLFQDHRLLFNEALTKHQTSTLRDLITKNELTPSEYLVEINDIKKLLHGTFSFVETKDKINLIEELCSEITIIVQDLIQIHKQLQLNDKEFEKTLYEFQKVRRVFANQVGLIREYHKLQCCNSMIETNKNLIEKFKILCKILNPQQDCFREKGLKKFKKIEKIILDLKMRFLGPEMKNAINNLINNLKRSIAFDNSNREMQDDEEEYYEEEYE